MVKINSCYCNCEEDPFYKPSRENILEVLQLIKNKGETLLEWAKKYQGNIRKNLTKMAKDKITCESYYSELVNNGFFDDKHITGVESEIIVENKMDKLF